MRLIFPVTAVACVLMAALPSQASRVRRGPTAGKQHRTGKQTTKTTPHQRAINDARASQIQAALVKAGYLQEASGHWDSTSEAAMQKMQAENGWQTKIIPDSRALIKLGLGPNSTSTGPQSALSAGPTDSENPDATGSR